MEQSLTVKLKKLWKNRYFQTAVIIGLFSLALLTLMYGPQAVLNTPYPLSAVSSGSMCVSYGAACDGWAHPFDRTLHVGDLIIVQGVDPQDLNADYPDSDIIVFHKPDDEEELIVHRIVATEERNGVLYFYTKGDGNGYNKWPTTPERNEYDPWNGGQGVPEDLVVGKVVMRIPWIGHVVLFMRNSVGLPIVIALIILIVVIEFVFPLLRNKKPPEQQEELQQQP